VSSIVKVPNSLVKWPMSCSSAPTMISSGWPLRSAIVAPLQHVFAHRHGLAQVFLTAAPIEDRADEGDNCLGSQSVDIWPHSAASSTPSRHIAS
jgi:hypothetical protein